jgi:hypothetical protein
MGRTPFTLSLRRLLCSVALALAATAGCHAQSPEEAFQYDADIFRLRHFTYYVGLIEEYRRVTGRYPLQGTEQHPIWVYIAHDRQIRYTRPGPSYTHVRVSFAEWVQEVERGLGREIDEFYDPQFVPTNRPNFYIYLIDGDRYYMTVHVSEAYPFAIRKGPQYNFVSVTNRPTGADRTPTPDSLLQTVAFIAASLRDPQKPGFFESRDAEYLHFTKRAGVAARELVEVKPSAKGQDARREAPPDAIRDSIR